MTSTSLGWVTARPAVGPDATHPRPRCLRRPGRRPRHGPPTRRSTRRPPAARRRSPRQAATGWAPVRVTWTDDVAAAGAEALLKSLADLGFDDVRDHPAGSGRPGVGDRGRARERAPRHCAVHPRARRRDRHGRRHRGRGSVRTAVTDTRDHASEDLIDWLRICLPPRRLVAGKLAPRRRTR